MKIEFLLLGILRSMHLNNGKRRLFTSCFRKTDRDSRIILLTAHRRENLGEPMRNMFRAINRIVKEHQDVQVSLSSSYESSCTRNCK